MTSWKRSGDLLRKDVKIFSSNEKELFSGGQATLKLTLECAVALRIDLSDANLSHANLVGAKLAGARLQGTNFSAANCYKADLSNADLRGAILHDTVLVGSDLRGADLRNADLTGARIERSSVFCATLVGAIMPRPKRRGRVKRWSDPF
jgi:uncharacterized protein YjbI with pentapeptide repeats